MISLGSPQQFVFESSVNIGCFREPPAISLASQESKDLFAGSPQQILEQGAPITSEGSPQRFCS